MKKVYEKPTAETYSFIAEPVLLETLSLGKLSVTTFGIYDGALGNLDQIED
mgnify:CR=1 FL=1